MGTMNINYSLLKLLGFILVSALSSCSTVEGVGKDVQGLGRIIQKSSSAASGNKSTTPATPSGDNQPAASGAVVTPVR